MFLMNGVTALLLPLAIIVLANAQVNFEQLYKIIHNAALPKPLYGGPTTKRLVMMLPGKILRAEDYYPGDDYVDSYTETNANKYLEIPPIKMQNLFNLVDVVPGIDPLQGQESGESFAVKYKRVLGLLTIRDLKEVNANLHQYSIVALNFLNMKSEQANSSDECNMIDECIQTNWDFYKHYEKIYNTKRKEVEEEIDHQRNSKSALEYQYWFTHTYPCLQAEVEGAYMDWLVKGKKDKVELHRAQLDTSTVGTLLLEAKTTLRSSGFIALDRTKTVYPVTFVPGDWYRHLRKDPELKLSIDQINVLITYLEIRRTILSAMINFTCNVTGALEGSGKFHEINGNVTSLMLKRCECIKNGGAGEDCDEFLQGIHSINKATDSTVFSLLAVKGLDALEGNPNAIESEIENIDQKLDSLKSELIGVGYDLPGFASAPLGPQPALDDDWFQFEYDSKTEAVNVEVSSQTTSASLGISSSIKRRLGKFSFGARRSVSYLKSTRDIFSSFNSTNVRVSGELLRVSVQMPWFRPELFDEKQLIMRDSSKVSPGPFETDADFVSSQKTDTYRLPQYITGLLLCRNLTLEFEDVQGQQHSSYSYALIAASLDVGADVNWGIFKLSARYARSSQKSSFEASKTATGLRIRVPGVQMIGYYTEVTPKFPKNEAYNDN